MQVHWLIVSFVMAIMMVIAGSSQLAQGAAKAAGKLTYKLGDGSETWDPVMRERIVKSMDAAIAIYNPLGDFDKTLTAIYSPGTPTADGSFNGTIRFGGSINTRVALHEIGHTLGVGTGPRWRELMKDGKWTGPYAIKQLHDLDGPKAELHGDTQHFWPYGLNYDQEGSEENFKKHVKMVIALRADMGIGPPPLPEALTAESLRCEYMTDPRGISITKPLLSWEDVCGRRGARQTVYQILVASTPEALTKDQGNLWDSGKVTSDDTSQIAYAGKTLTSRQSCFWKVRVWDEASHPGEWSKVARWTMGLLKPEDWTAQWIDAKPLAEVAVADGGLKIIKATYGTTDEAVTKDVTATIAAAVHDGQVEMPVKNEALGGDLAYGKSKQLRVDYEYRGQPSQVTLAENKVLKIPDVPAPLPYLRRGFKVEKPVRQATVYATALGIYELRINGQRVGDQLLAPEWTDYSKRLNYQDYDVTAMVKKGDNALAALVGNGWYAGHIGNGGFQHWGRVPGLMAQLEITFEDGTTQRIVTDDSWKVGKSPVLSSDMMLGESYDARKETAGWDMPGLDETHLTQATLRSEPAHHLEGPVMDPVRQVATLNPRALHEPAPGHWVFDLGQNMVGVVRLKVTADAGTKITIRHAEMLNPDGTMYTANLRGAPSVDTYICRGGGEETWQPRFTFHGFRYVEITGLPGKPPMDTITGIVIASATPAAGTFSCSDTRINQLMSNIQWGQRGNYLSVPTDCPQRDERLGWMGDAQVFVGTAIYNADVMAFFNKWLVDVDDAQTADGRFTDVSPNTMTGSGTPAWADAGVICPWVIYQSYGDKRVLEQHLPAMIRWVEWCRTHSTNLLRDHDRGNDFGDWLSIKADTPKDVIGTAYFAHSAQLLAKTARVLGKPEVAAKYDQLFTDIKAAFNKAYVSTDGRIKGDTQCVYAMALKFDLLPEAARAQAAQFLEEDIKAKGDHLSTGFVGVSYLLPTLTQAGKTDTAFKLLMQDSFPSWLFSVKHGATTIWERWDGWTPEKGFQDPGMNSFNHYSLGSCGQWLFESVAGIAPDPDKPGFKHVLLHPRIGGGLTSAKAEFRSIRGMIASAWTIKDGILTWEISIPANTAATVFVPGGDATEVQESGKSAKSAEGIKWLRNDKGAGVFEIQAGKYAFTAAIRK